MRIGLFGIGGVYNFGCEAIVRGAVHLIRDVYPDSQIYYFSFSYNYDKRMLEDLDIHIVKVDYYDTFLKKVIRKISNIIKLQHRPFRYRYQNVLNYVDEVWSIGGDILTIPEVVRQQSNYDYYIPLVDFCDRAIRKGKKVVLYGASVGPFGEKTKAEKYFINNLKKYKMILCREGISQRYLLDCGLSNVYFLPDPAFQVRLSYEGETEQNYIGVNFSPLSLEEIYGDTNEDKAIHLAKIVGNILDEFDYDILMIPHVIADSERDDDLRFQKTIIKLVDEERRNRVLIANYENGFLGIKKELSKCRMVVTARMHCAINAIVEDVPTIMLSYSQKSIGMCEYVYGNREWVLDLKNIDENLVTLMKKMDEENSKIRRDLMIRNKEIEDEYMKLKSQIL